MNKQEFINELDSNFDNLIHKDAKKLLEYFNELYEDKLEDGLTDNEIITSFGDVDLLADKLINELAQTTKPQTSITKDNEKNIISKVYKPNEINSIDININYNDINISQSIDDNFHIEYSSELNILTHETKRICIGDVNLYDNNSIVTTFKNSTKTIKKSLFSNFANIENLNIENVNIKIPKNNSIDFNIKTVNGDININKIDNINSLSFISTSGDIEIENINFIDKLKIKTTSGDLFLKNNQKINILDFDCKSGDVKVINSNFNTLFKIKCTSGDTFVQDSIFYDNMSIKNTSGDFDLQDIIIHKNIEVITSSGDGTISILGKKENFELIDLKTTNNINDNSNLKKIIYSCDDIEIKFV